MKGFLRDAVVGVAFFTLGVLVVYFQPPVRQDMSNPEYRNNYVHGLLCMSNHGDQMDCHRACNKNRACEDGVRSGWQEQMERNYPALARQGAFR